MTVYVFDMIFFFIKLKLENLSRDALCLDEKMVAAVTRVVEQHGKAQR